VFLLLEGAGQPGQFVGDLAGDFGAAAGGIERERVGPDFAESFAMAFLAQFSEKHLIMGTFAAARRRPAFNECLNVVLTRHGRSFWGGRGEVEFCHKW
jgi:hypothetical protein